MTIDQKVKKVVNTKKVNNSIEHLERIYQSDGDIKRESRLAPLEDRHTSSNLKNLKYTKLDTI